MRKYVASTHGAWLYILQLPVDCMLPTKSCERQNFTHRCTNVQPAVLMFCREDRGTYGIRVSPQQCQNNNQDEEEDDADNDPYKTFNGNEFVRMQHPHLAQNFDYYDFDSIMHYPLVNGEMWLHNDAWPSPKQAVRMLLYLWWSTFPYGVIRTLWLQFEKANNWCTIIKLLTMTKKK